MKKEENTPRKFDSLSDAHRAFGLGKPLHPLISLINNADTTVEFTRPPQSHVLNFYKISYRARLGGKLKYGQDYYDFDEGGLLFAAPNQIIGSYSDTAECTAGYALLIHPDFFRNYPLGKKIKQYGFFSYSANEALHLSDKEKATIISIFKIIEEIENLLEPSNVKQDHNLRSRMNENGYVHIDFLKSLPSINTITTDTGIILSAIQRSKKLKKEERGPLLIERFFWLPALRRHCLRGLGGRSEALQPRSALLESSRLDLHTIPYPFAR